MSDTSHIGESSLAGINSPNSIFNALTLMIQRMIGQTATATVVEVVATSDQTVVGPFGTVDVQPLVNQVDGSGNSVPHGVLHGLPFFRLQGGENAIVMDPQVGDIGIAVFASRDISSVKATLAQANPGSGRTYDMADGIYIGGILNSAASQSLTFSETGINALSALAINLQAPLINAVGTLSAPSFIVPPGPPPAVTPPNGTIYSTSAGTFIVVGGFPVPIGGGGGGSVQSVGQGTNIQVTGTPQNPIVNVLVPINSFTSATIAPGGPINGDRWFDTASGIQYAWLTSFSVWVQI